MVQCVQHVVHSLETSWRTIYTVNMKVCYYCDINVLFSNAFHALTSMDEIDLTLVFCIVLSLSWMIVEGVSQSLC